MPTARPAALLVPALLGIVTPALARGELVCPGATETYGFTPPPVILSVPDASPEAPDLFGPAPLLPALDLAPPPVAPMVPGPAPLALDQLPPEHAVLIQVSPIMHDAALTARAEPAPADRPRRLDSVTSAASFAGLTAAGAIIGLAIRKLPR